MNSSIHISSCSGDLNKLVICLIEYSKSNANKGKSIMNGIRDVIDVRNKFGLTPLHGACFYGQYKVAQYLLDMGACPNAKSYSSPPFYGASPLHLAALNGHVNLVKLLLGRGANSSFKDSKGCDPLRIAEIHNHQDCFQILKKSNADMLYSIESIKEQLENKESKSVETIVKMDNHANSKSLNQIACFISKLIPSPKSARKQRGLLTAL
jgi:ankyrin repeat protein